MKKSILWNILLIIGIVPLVLPFAFGIYKISIESWTMFDWLVMYSYIFWPTYLASAIAIAISVVGRIVKK